MTLVIPTITRYGRGKDREPTATELRRLQDEAGVEFVDGVLVEDGMSKDSSGVTFEAGFHLRAAADKSLVKFFDSSLAYRCFPWNPKLFRKPDVSVVRKERLREADLLGTDVGEMPIPADLVIEVISPNDIAYEVRGKVADYHRASFGDIWLLYPEQKVIELCRPRSTTVLMPDDRLNGVALLPALDVRVADLFEE